MSNAAAAALATLGLSTEVATVDTTVEVVNVSSEEVGSVEAVVGTTEVAQSTDTKAEETKKAAEFAAGEVSDFSFDELPALKRNFVGGSTRTIYGIEDLAAPGTDGKKYHGKLVAYESGDVVAFKRSVQSSATGQNKKAKEQGTDTYYVTRSHEVGGEFKGVFVIRTDERPVDEAPEADGTAAE